jgi:hypothetical protein
VVDFSQTPKQPVKTLTPELLQALPLYLDGSDGSLWPARCCREQWAIFAECPEIAARRFVRVSDLLMLLGESPTESTAIPQVAQTPNGDTVSP